MASAPRPYPNVIESEPSASAWGPCPNVIRLGRRGCVLTPGSAVPLLSGLDTLHLFSRAPVRSDVEAYLVAAKAAAVHASKKRSPLPTALVAGIRFEIQPGAARTAPYLLLSENMAVAVNPTPARGLPTLAIELRSIFLWQRGAHGAHDVALAVGDQLADRQPLLGPGGVLAPPEVQLAVTRVDLTLDFQGWIPPADPLAYTTRATRITPHYDRCRFTGLSIGRGAIMARIYDKTLELRASGKDWFYDVWGRTHRFDPARPVWRIEFQLRRVGLRSFRLGRDDQRIGNFFELAPAAGALWRHLMTRWLAIKAPRTSRSRQQLAPAWEVLHSRGFADGLWNGSPGNLYRLARASAASRCLGQLNGYMARYLATESARTGLPPNLDEMGPRMLAAVRRHGDRTGQPTEGKAARLVQDWGAAEREARGLVEPAADSDEKEPDDDLDP